MRRGVLTRNLGLAFAALAGMAAASSAFSAAAGGSGVGHRLAHHRGMAVSPSVLGQWGAANRIGRFSTGPRAGYSGTLPRLGTDAHDGSGWYQSGFGGTLNPGWGYNFGPSLGGSLR